MGFAGVWGISQRGVGVLLRRVAALLRIIKKALNLKAFLRIYGAGGDSNQALQASYIVGWRLVWFSIYSQIYSLFVLCPPKT